ncbi:MAG TPA: hypothetical protein VHS80_00500, partial [Chthoniobacterales bacterium]|nr:hypothetical protein [Chthoniobacterales bacterium]
AQAGKLPAPLVHHKLDRLPVQALELKTKIQEMSRREVEARNVVCAGTIKPIVAIESDTTWFAEFSR